MKKLTIRLDDELHDRIEQAAARDDRSLNGEITSLLKAGLDASKPVVSGRIYAYSQEAYDAVRAAGLPVVAPGQEGNDG